MITTTTAPPRFPVGGDLLKRRFLLDERSSVIEPTLHEEHHQIGAQLHQHCEFELKHNPTPQDDNSEGVGDGGDSSPEDPNDDTYEPAHPIIAVLTNNEQIGHVTVANNGQQQIYSLSQQDEHNLQLQTNIDSVRDCLEEETNHGFPYERAFCPECSERATKGNLTFCTQCTSPKGHKIRRMVSCEVCDEPIRYNYYYQHLYKTHLEFLKHKYPRCVYLKQMRDGNRSKRRLMRKKFSTSKQQQQLAVVVEKAPRINSPLPLPPQSQVITPIDNQTIASSNQMSGLDELQMAVSMIEKQEFDIQEMKRPREEVSSVSDQPELKYAKRDSFKQKYCPICGIRFGEHHRFCGECGSRRE